MALSNRHPPENATMTLNANSGCSVVIPPFPAQPSSFPVPAVRPQMHNGLEPSASVTKPPVCMDTSLLRQKDDEIDALMRDVRRHQAAAEAVKRELLQRSLQVHQLEETLRDTRDRFEEHKAKSHILLEERQREYETLRLLLEQMRNDAVADPGAGKGDASDLASTQLRVSELESTAVSFEKERDWLQAQVASCMRDVVEAHEQCHVVAQKLESAQLELRGVQEALESEVAAHQRSKSLLHGRQRELNELRAAVERQGGTFSASGALITLRGEEEKMHDDRHFSRQLLDKQKALEAALNDAAEWRRRCERATHRLEEERTTRVVVPPALVDHDSNYSTASHFRRMRKSNGGRLLLWAGGCVCMLDAAVLRVGLQLRRTPMLRIAVVLYIFCLHVGLLVAIMLALLRSPETGAYDNTKNKAA
ncbi:hypothetical protein, conserved [Trypanosoma vivax Y486]|uniref:Transmembrane protein n=1 Tax=Trypanosoma vivax (strain Y486) TaxID=1055687 RepID=F9WTQ7_TRYVY|nr:hypothetical protein, conserved [Trypanosoma vivax Y486]|eukprot:CCD20951.1 hypothetical protein, conserved [Trypanosoma vivax Y486]